MAGFGLRLTPHGHLVADSQDDAPDIDAPVAGRLTELETNDMAALFGLDMGGGEAPEAAGGDAVRPAPADKGSDAAARKVPAGKPPGWPELHPVWWPLRTLPRPGSYRRGKPLSPGLKRCRRTFDSRPDGNRRRRRLGPSRREGRYACQESPKPSGFGPGAGSMVG
jgi:hypothetical protein